MRRLVLIAAAAMMAALLLPVAASAAPPTVNSFIVKNGNTATFDRTVSVQINVTGDVRMRFSVNDGGSWTEWGESADTTDVVLPDLDGTYTVTGEFESDTAETVQASDSIVLDRVAPDAFLHTDSEPNTAGWYKKAPVFWFTNSEPPVVFYWWNDPAAWIGFYPGSTAESPTAPVGENTLYYYARDDASNDGPTLSRLFRVDETSPTASVEGTTEAWTKTDQTVTLAAADEGGSGLDQVHWRIDGHEVNSGAPGQLTIDTEGDHLIDLWSTDFAGNVSSPAQAHVKVDKSAPTITVAGLNSGWVSAQTPVSLSATDGAGSGVQSLSWTLDSGAPQSTSTVPITGDSVHNLVVTATDNAGNTTSTPHAIKIDSKAPVTSSNAVASYERSAVIALDASDGVLNQVSGVAKTEWRLDGGAWQSTPLPPVTELGTHTLDFRSTDNVGNTEQAKSVTFRVWSRTALLFAPLAAAPKYNGEGTLDVRLVDSAGAVLPNQTVVFSRWDGTKWLEFKVTTEENGYVHLRSQYLTTARTYVIRFDSTDKYEAAATVTYTFLPKVKLTRSTSWKTLSRGKAYYAKGYIEPKHGKTNANKVKVLVLKRGADKKYRLYKTFTASYSAVTGSTTKSRYTAKVVLKKKGTYKLVAYHAADSANAETYGSADFFTVK